MDYGKFFRAGTAALAAAGVMLSCGCSVKFGTNSEPKLSEVVAKPTSENYDADMEITYEEFKKRYSYSLIMSGIEDDTDESVADACKAQRKNTIENLVTEHIFLQKAKELGVENISDEDMKLINDQYSAQVKSLEDKYGSEELDRMLESCGMVRDDLRVWLVNYAISLNVTDKINEGISYSDAQAQTDAFIEQAKKLYAEDIGSYQSGGFYELWLPEGSRLIKYFALDFDDDVKQEILALRESGDNETADALRDKNAEEKSETVSQLQERIANGEDYKILLLLFSSNAAAASLYPDGYLFIPNGTGYGEELQNKAFELEKIGDSLSYADDNGVYVLFYSDDAKVDADAVKSVTDELYGQMAETQFYSKLTEWRREYGYSIEYEKLRLDPPTT